MKKTILALAFSGLTLVGIVLAQGGPAGQTPAMAAKFAKYQPWFDLSGTIRVMIDVDKQPNLAFTKTQAKLALPILKDLGARPALKPEDATKITNTLEDKVVTPAQLKWMDEQRLVQDEARRKRLAQQNAQTGQTTSIVVPGAGRVGGGQGGGQGGGNRAMFDAIQNDKPFNPFKAGRNADSLKQLVDILSKK